MPSREPVFSVLMTAHNAEKYIGAAVTSVLAQSFGDFELVMVDDGSTDATYAVVSALADPRVKIHRLDRKIGRTQALNLGLRLACGRFVAILDADDESLPDRLAAQAAYLEAHPDTVLVGGSFQFMDSQGAPGEIVTVPQTDQAIREILALYNPFAHSAVAYRRAAAMRVGGYPSNYVYSQDFALYLKLVRFHRLANLPDLLCRLRRHDAQMTRSREYELCVLGESSRLMRLARGLCPPSPEIRRKSLEFYGEWEGRYVEALCGQGRWPLAAARVLQAVILEPAQKTSWSLIPRLFRSGTAPGQSKP